MSEAAPQPTIQMMSTSEPAVASHSVPTIVDTQSLHGGKIRIVNEDMAAALQPTRKIITINQQQYVVSQGGFFLE